MEIFSSLEKVWKHQSHPFMICNDKEIFFDDILNYRPNFLNKIKQGDVVILIGDYDNVSISLLFHLIELRTIVVPITKNSNNDYNYFIEACGANIIIANNSLTKIDIKKKHNSLLENLRRRKQAGLIFFSTGTTGKPKAILHDVNILFKRFFTPRTPYKTINFLLFDHMGGINTLLHTLFNGGTIVTPVERSVKSIIELCEKNKVELLPATPTFLRMLLLSGIIPKKIPKSIKIISYGTELMDTNTLSELCRLLPNIDFKQTYGLSEFCVLRVKNKSREGLSIKIGGEGVETKIQDDQLHIRSKYSMLGYLNAQSPFDKNGWYNTKDIVEQDKDGYLRIVGRNSEVVNVGGIKFMKSEVENVLLGFDGIEQIKIITKTNPITGQHIEAIIQTEKNKKVELKEIKKYIKNNLQGHMQPQKIIFDDVKISHRVKKQ